MSDDRFYVYLLRDPRQSDYLQSIFYVGKGTQLRADQHRKDADELFLSEVGLVDAGDQSDDETLSRKNAILRELSVAGYTPEVDVISARQQLAIGEERAFDVEAGLIAVLQQGGHLTNNIKGRELNLYPGAVFTKTTNASRVLLNPEDSAVVVPVSGLWGGVDYAGTILGATPDQIWENARRTWSPFASTWQQIIRERAETDKPVLLIALAKDPRGVLANVIVGVFGLKNVYESNHPEDRKGGPPPKRTYPGWVMEKLQTPPEAVLETERRLIGNELVVNGGPLPRPQDRRYIGAWTNN